MKPQRPSKCFSCSRNNRPLRRRYNWDPAGRTGYRTTSPVSQAIERCDCGSRRSAVDHFQARGNLATVAEHPASAQLAPPLEDSEGQLAPPLEDSEGPRNCCNRGCHRSHPHQEARKGQSPQRSRPNKACFDLGNLRRCLQSHKRTDENGNQLPLVFS